ncbi:hypothetical protein [Thermomonospora amylolytica]|uniref:hypothetical protein n=1 Tax=Thermomonospora amylolytica TaxID=1411117 RepID=UPI00130041AB|nr:hypothetical protein [Thermomonospora amylolytica]
MDEQERQERRRIAERAAAFDVIMVNLPTAGDANRGDKEIRERAREVFEKLRPDKE